MNIKEYFVFNEGQRNRETQGYEYCSNNFLSNNKLMLLI